MENPSKKKRVENCGCHDCAVWPFLTFNTSGILLNYLFFFCEFLAFFLFFFVCLSHLATRARTHRQPTHQFFSRTLFFFLSFFQFITLGNEQKIYDEEWKTSRLFYIHNTSTARIEITWAYRVSFFYVLYSTFFVAPLCSHFRPDDAPCLGITPPPSARSPQPNICPPIFGGSIVICLKAHFFW